MNFKSFYSFLICLALNAAGFSQSLTTKESAALQTSLNAHFNRQVPLDDYTIKVKIDAPREAFLCLLNIDSMGKIESIHWLGEAPFKDSAYAIFTRMKVSDFKNWQVEKCKGKTIVIPINVVKSFAWKDLNKLSGLAVFFKPGESGDLIIIRGLSFSWPVSQFKKSSSSN